MYFHGCATVGSNCVPGENKISVLEWPKYSPYLNPFENLTIMKDNVAYNQLSKLRT